MPHKKSHSRILREPSDLHGSPACGYHNHEGCRRGRSCYYRHYSDGESIPDSRQKNVCYHFIMGNCKYNDGSCWYSHDLSHLMPSKKKVAALAGRRKVIGKETDKEELFKKMTELKESGQFGKDLPFRKRRRGGNGEVMLDLDEDDDDLDGGMFGFSAADVELLLEQGIKPWDDDAEAALAVLSYY